MGRCYLLAHAKTQHNAVGLEDQREWRSSSKEAETKSIPIELLGAGDVDDGEKIQ